MSFAGKIQNGVVVLPPDVKLPDGTEVEVVFHGVQPQENPFFAAFTKTAKSRPHWPRDYALNHGHYISGEPRKLRVQSSPIPSFTSLF